MIFDEVYNIIRKRHLKKLEETLIIGIGGNTGSGKSTFAKEFSEFLKTKNIQTLIHENDFYQAPRNVKVKKRKELIEREFDKGDNWWKIVGEEIYYNNYNRDLMEKHLISLKLRQDIPETNVYDKQSGEWNKPISYKFNGSTEPLWILHEGVYLFHPQVRKHLDKIVVITTGEEKIVSDIDLGEITEERKIRFERVSKRGLERGYKVDFYSGFLPLDIHTARHIREGLKYEKDATLVDNSNFNNRKIISPR